MKRDTTLSKTKNVMAHAEVSSCVNGPEGIIRAANQTVEDLVITQEAQEYAVSGLEDVTSLALEIQGITPLSMMFRGFDLASRSFAINSIVAEQLQDAAMSQAQSMLRFTHVIASIWIEPEPIGPISVASKVNRTRDALLQHIQATADDSLERLLVFNEVVISERDSTDTKT